MHFVVFLTAEKNTHKAISSSGDDLQTENLWCHYFAHEKLLSCVIFSKHWKSLIIGLSLALTDCTGRGGSVIKSRGFRIITKNKNKQHHESWRKHCLDEWIYVRARCSLEIEMEN